MIDKVVDRKRDRVGEKERYKGKGKFLVGSDLLYSFR